MQIMVKHGVNLSLRAVEDGRERLVAPARQRQSHTKDKSWPLPRPCQLALSRWPQVEWLILVHARVMNKERGSWVLWWAFSMYKGLIAGVVGGWGSPGTFPRPQQQQARPRVISLK